MYRPSQTPRLTVSSDRVARRHQGGELRSRTWALARRSPSHRISKGTTRVVVFHGRLAAPTYATPLVSLHTAKLESSSTARPRAARGYPFPMARVFWKKIYVYFYVL
ncbi:hypothetical protein DPMN_102386 [Dreissena polymorpha]|uniref:Uncharacterized protein n=1 Tax=Dreissena polymorpha TaxID=45954 RepID=A0A9D4LKV3_DREPO|nr:hypothetical protein DPMN_102386 [Dreissena polymorpha]